MRNIFLIAKREYLEQVRKRAFLLSTIAIPALFAVIIGLIIFTSRGINSSKHIVIASNDAALAMDVKAQLSSGHDTKSVFDVQAPVTDADRAGLDSKVHSKAIDGFLWIDSAAGHEPVVSYTAQSSGDIATIETLSEALNRAVIRQRLSSSGMQSANVDTLLKHVSIQTSQVNKEGKEVKSNALTSFFKGYFMALMLTMTTMIYGLNVARSIIQEKTSRIFEVMLAIAKPTDMLAGKLIGAGAVGLTQIGIWIVAASLLLPIALVQPGVADQLNLQFSAIEAIYFAVYFVLGYLFQAALFSGLAASCETEQELQMFTPLAAVPVWLSFSLIMLVINNPDSALSIGASLFPVTSPIIMMLRLGSQRPPEWQFAASIAILVVSILGLLWLSARLYRVGILMYGKRATLPELLRWLRYS